MRYLGLVPGHALSAPNATTPSFRPLDINYHGKNTIAVVALGFVGSAGQPMWPRFPGASRTVLSVTRT